MGFRPPAVPSTGGAMPNPGEAADIRSSANAAAGLGDVGSLFVGGPVGRGLNYGLSLMDLLGGQAQAGERDPRAVRIDRLNASVAENQKKLQSFATQNFRSTKARSDASQPILDAIKSDQAEAARLQGQMDDEFKAANDLRIAEERGAAWRNTPLAKKYPELQYGTSAAGGLAGMLAGFALGRRPVAAYNRTAQNLDRQWRAALDTANDASLAPAVRNQARRTAEQIMEKAGNLQQPHLGLKGLAGGALVGGGLTDLGMMLPTISDYASSFSDPEGTLHGFSAEQLLDPHRYAAGATIGGTVGTVAQKLGDLFTPRADAPDYTAETQALPKRYAAPRKSAPRAPRARR
jgi:hypothetical protein